MPKCVAIWSDLEGQSRAGYNQSAAQLAEVLSTCEAPNSSLNNRIATSGAVSLLLWRLAPEIGTMSMLSESENGRDRAAGPVRPVGDL